MEWVLRSPQIHSTFSNLGYVLADVYRVNDNCNAALETILHNILTEDKYLRSYRRSISFGQNVKKDLIPLLIHAKEVKTIELLIRILVNLTIPIECLISVDVISRDDFGRHTIFEINNLLASTKVAFTDYRATKVVVDFIKKNINFEQKAKLSSIQCTNITNSLLLLRNILHIPEESNIRSPHYSGPAHAVQNQILWNTFSQSIDKVLIKLMTIPDANKWAVTMVQLIALLYKDQHVVTLDKFLNLWLETSLSESSEDNESNTSPLDRDPTSDSSDAGSSPKSTGTNSHNKSWDAPFMNSSNKTGGQVYAVTSVKEAEASELEFANDDINMKFIGNKRDSSSCSGEISDQVKFSSISNKKPVISENSDCGYGTQIENQGSISTSSSDDDFPAKKPVHQKPHNPKQRMNNKMRSGVIMTQERKRKKIIKRGKSSIINVQGLTHKTPTDDDISNVLQEFTVDFLLKGYNTFVHTLHSQILTNPLLEIDTSHFFWLITYFLKFATKMELELDHVASVLSFDIVSYLTAEGVNLCEQFEIAIKQIGTDVRPIVRRQHLVVTALRELVQAIDTYKKFSHICEENRDALIELQFKMCETDELRSLLVLLLRHYNLKYHSKQYLQDLIVTNHILLTFVDKAMKLPNYNGKTNLIDHLQQFATSEIMYNYGLLLEDYLDNGEFVNDCVFTLMHHVAELGSLITLFQPKILKAFTSIWKTEYEICDDWSDLIEYVINTFVKKPHALQSKATFRLNTENFDDDKVAPKADVIPGAAPVPAPAPAAGPPATQEKWTDDELSSLSWNYMQLSTQPDIIGAIIKMFKEDDIIKSRYSVIDQLFKQNVINKHEFDKLVNGEGDGNPKTTQLDKEMKDSEIEKLCKQLVEDGTTIFLDWVQKVLLDTCFAKIYLEKKARNNNSNWPVPEIKFLKSEKSYDLSPVSYHALLFSQSVPLVPWNCKQAAICKDPKFLQLLHKLGFLMPVDSGKAFIRIPNSWTADYLYDIARKITPIDKSKLKFSMNDISDSSIANSKQQDSLVLSADLTNDITMIETSDNFYQINRQKHPATMVNFTPMPGSSFNTDAAEVDKHSWLEVVKKSQDYKITLNLESIIVKDEELESDIGMDVAAVNEENSPSPPDHVVSAEQETTPLNVQNAGSEYCNTNLCETVSVASDLPHMYVSGEYEKPEVMLQPVTEANTCMDEQPSCVLENAGESPQVTDFPTF